MPACNEAACHRLSERQYGAPVFIIVYSLIAYVYYASFTNTFVPAFSAGEATKKCFWPVKISGFVIFFLLKVKKDLGGKKHE